MAKKKRISMSIDPALLDSLAAFCKREKRSISNAAEIAIEEYLKNHTKGKTTNVKS